MYLERELSAAKKALLSSARELYVPPDCTDEDIDRAIGGHFGVEIYISFRQELMRGQLHRYITLKMERMEPDQVTPVLDHFPVDVATVSFFDLSTQTRNVLADLFIAQISQQECNRIPPDASMHDRVKIAQRLERKSIHLRDWLLQVPPWEDVVRPEIGYQLLQKTHSEFGKESA